MKLTKTQKYSLLALGVAVVAIIVMKKRQEMESKKPVIVATTRPLIIEPIA